jgi:hypothetical protein
VGSASKYFTCRTSTSILVRLKLFFCFHFCAPGCRTPFSIRQSFISVYYPNGCHPCIYIFLCPGFAYFAREPSIFSSFTPFRWSAYACHSSCTVGYATGAEANCTAGLCCRSNTLNPTSPNKTLVPAPRYGSYKWCVSSLASEMRRMFINRRGFLPRHGTATLRSRSLHPYSRPFLFLLVHRTRVSRGPYTQVTSSHTTRRINCLGESCSFED